jgi:hypothetical protein
METKVVHIKDGYDVYIGRPSIFGYPFIIGKHGSRYEVISKYKKYFYDLIETNEDFKNQIFSLKCKKLGCYCSPQKCHGDIIVEFLENKEDEI